MQTYEFSPRHLLINCVREFDTSMSVWSDELSEVEKTGLRDCSKRIRDDFIKSFYFCKIVEFLSNTLIEAKTTNKVVFVFNGDNIFPPVINDIFETLLIVGFNILIIRSAFSDYTLKVSCSNYLKNKLVLLCARKRNTLSTLKRFCEKYGSKQFCRRLDNDNLKMYITATC